MATADRYLDFEEELGFRGPNAEEMLANRHDIIWIADITHDEEIKHATRVKSVDGGHIVFQEECASFRGMEGGCRRVLGNMRDNQVSQDVNSFTA